jgi:hypothetical protein
MPDVPKDRALALNALGDAGALYRRYLELAQITNVVISDPSEGERVRSSASWTHPLGVVMRPGAQSAVVE